MLFSIMSRFERQNLFNLTDELKIKCETDNKNPKKYQLTNADIFCDDGTDKKWMTLLA